MTLVPGTLPRTTRDITSVRSCSVEAMPRGIGGRMNACMGMAKYESGQIVWFSMTESWGSEWPRRVCQSDMVLRKRTLPTCANILLSVSETNQLLKSPRCSWVQRKSGFTRRCLGRFCSLFKPNTGRKLWRLVRGGANMAHQRHSGPDFGLACKV